MLPKSQIVRGVKKSAFDVRWNSSGRRRGTIWWRAGVLWQCDLCRSAPPQDMESASALVWQRVTAHVHVRVHEGWNVCRFVMTMWQCDRWTGGRGGRRLGCTSLHCLSVYNTVSSVSVYYNMYTRHFQMFSKLHREARSAKCKGQIKCIWKCITDIAGPGMAKRLHAARWAF